MARRYPTDWACTCGKRHTGLPLDPAIWGEDAAKHRPVSTLEVRFANSPLAGQLVPTGVTA